MVRCIAPRIKSAGASRLRKGVSGFTTGKSHKRIRLERGQQCSRHSPPLERVKIQPHSTRTLYDNRLSVYPAERFLDFIVLQFMASHSCCVRFLFCISTLMVSVFFLYFAIL
jgi:hypothetical protein